MKKADPELPIPRTQLGILLFSSAVLLLLGIAFDMYLSDFVSLFLVCGFVLFLPAYVIVGMDIAARKITHRWSVFMLTLPFIAPFVYYFVRDKLKPVQPELV